MRETTTSRKFRTHSAAAQVNCEKSSSSLSALPRRRSACHARSAKLPGKYVFGGYYWGLENTSLNDVSYPGKFGFYWQAAQMLWREPSARTALGLSCCPTSPAAFVMARQMGGDEALASGPIALSTLFCSLSLALVLWLTA